MFPLLCCRTGAGFFCYSIRQLELVITTVVVLTIVIPVSVVVHPVLEILVALVLLIGYVLTESAAALAVIAHAVIAVAVVTVMVIVFAVVASAVAAVFIKPVFVKSVLVIAIGAKNIVVGRAAFPVTTVSVKAVYVVAGAVAPVPIKTGPIKPLAVEACTIISLSIEAVPVKPLAVETCMIVSLSVVPVTVVAVAVIPMTVIPFLVVVFVLVFVLSIVIVFITTFGRHVLRHVGLLLDQLTVCAVRAFIERTACLFVGQRWIVIIISEAVLRVERILVPLGVTEGVAFFSALHECFFAALGNAFLLPGCLTDPHPGLEPSL